MLRERVILAVCGLAALGASGLAWYEHGRVDAIARDVAAAKSARAGAPERVVVERERVIEHERAAPSPAAAPIEAPSPLGSPSDTDAKRPARTYTDEEIARTLDARFEHEARDPAWSDAAAGDIERAARDAHVDGARFERVECRASLCRVVTWFASPAAERAAMEKLVLGPEAAIKMGAMQLTDLDYRSDGSLSAEMWIARQGAIALGDI